MSAPHPLLRGRWRALWNRADVALRDLPLALGLAAVSLVPSFQSHGTTIGTVPDRPADLLLLLVIAVECLPLALRRRMPASALALVAVGFVADQLLGYHSPAGAALPIVVFSAGLHLRRGRWLAPLLLLVGIGALGVALGRRGGAETLGELGTFALALALAWGAGTWVRSVRMAEAERRTRAAEAARESERTRIARDLHDVVTHHVTAMVVQAEAAQYLIGDTRRLGETLETITTTGRHAVADLRQMLDVLSDGDAATRTPAAGEIRALVRQTQDAGQPVEFCEEGVRRNDPGSAELVAYRVVQESLTNAMKYARGRSTQVTVVYGGEDIVVRVLTAGEGGRNRIGGSGRGLEGLAQRVRAVGGEFHAGPAAEGFLVSARIPGGSA